MSNINFYEVISPKGKWQGNYSPKLDHTINCGASAFTMAVINAKHCGGEIFEVNFEGERKAIALK